MEMTGTYATQHFTESKDSCFNHEKVIRYINNRIEGLLTEGDK